MVISDQLCSLSVAKITSICGAECYMKLFYILMISTVKSGLLDPHGLSATYYDAFNLNPLKTHSNTNIKKDRRVESRMF